MKFMTFLLDVMIVFIFIMWFWLLITVMADLFRRDDAGGSAKVIWIVALVLLPYLGVFAYLLTQGSGWPGATWRRPMRRATSSARSSVSAPPMNSTSLAS